MTVFSFYLFALVTVIAGFLVVVSRNPVHSVLWLILAFISSAGLFVLLGAEFVAMILVIVYVGAVAVLFLFVVMMLDVDFAKLRGSLAQYLPLGLLIGVILLAAYLRLHHDIQAIRRGEVDLPPEYQRPLEEDRQETKNPFGKSGR